MGDPRRGSLGQNVAVVTAWVAAWVSMRDGLVYQGIRLNQAVSGIVSALMGVLCQGVAGYHPETVGTLLI